MFLSWPCIAKVVQSLARHLLKPPGLFPEGEWTLDQLRTAARFAVTCRPDMFSEMSGSMRRHKEKLLDAVAVSRATELAAASHCQKPAPRRQALLVAQASVHCSGVSCHGEELSSYAMLRAEALQP